MFWQAARRLLSVAYAKAFMLLVARSRFAFSLVQHPLALI